MNKRLTSIGAVATALLLSTSMAMAQKWTPLVHKPTGISAYNPMLLTDGTVLVQDGNANGWYKLTPDITGSYLKGTWSKVANAPTNFGPLYYASQVLMDGRVFMMGGEYNMGSGAVWSNLGAIYDPVKNTWANLTAPAGWANIGDMGSITLPNGKVFFCNPFTNQGGLFDPVTNKITAPYGTGKFDANDEEGLTLLPNGKILTVDTTSGHSELFDPITLLWTNAGTTPASLVGDGEEIGPQVLRPDGTVICFGGGPHNCIYNSNTGKWSQAPDYPIVNGVQMVCADAPAVLLRNGNVLVQTGPTNFGAGSNFFEFDGTKFTAVPGPSDAPFVPSFVGNFLMLPTGEVLYCGQSSHVEIYTSTGKPDPSWAPTITSWPTTIKPGQTYTITGTQFNGLSGCSSYGDDEQNTTNYPLIRITNKATGHVFYCREFNPSTMAVATGSKIVSTSFQVPTTLEIGLSTLEVVTNGIASAAVPVSSSPLYPATGVSVYEGTSGVGTVSDIWQTDGSVFSCTSANSSVGQVASIEADFTITSTSPAFFGLTAYAASSVATTGMIYIYDWKLKSFVYQLSKNLTSGQTSIGATLSGDLSRFVSPTGAVRILVRGVNPSRLGQGSFKFNVDSVQIAVY